MSIPCPPYRNDRAFDEESIELGPRVARLAQDLARVLADERGALYHRARRV